MSDYSPSAALLRTRIVSKGSQPEDHAFANGQGTRAVTHAYLKQAASRVAEKVVATAKRLKPTTEERQKEIELRRKWAGGGNMPADVRACYSEAERAALAVIADRCKQRGFCDLSIEEIMRIAGVKRTSVQNALRKAQSKQNAHISVRERRPSRGVKSLTNIIKIIGKTWLTWIERGLSFRGKSGFKHMNTSETADKISLSKQEAKPIFAFEREGAANSFDNRNSCISGEKVWHTSRNRFGWPVGQTQTSASASMTASATHSALGASGTSLPGGRKPEPRS